MGSHEWWHLFVLGSTLMGAAALVIVGLYPLMFGQETSGSSRWRKIALGLVGVAAVLLIVEWLAIH